MGDLLPCPFCQKPAEIGGFTAHWYCRCSDANCWAGNHASLWMDEAEAIAVWNTRAPVVAHETASDARQAPAHAEPVAWVNMADWSDLPDVYVTKAECQQGMFWRIEACSVPMVIGPEVRLVRADRMPAHPPTDEAEIERLRAEVIGCQWALRMAESRASEQAAEIERLQNTIHDNNRSAIAKISEATEARMKAEARVAELERLIHEVSDPDFLWGAMDNVNDMDVGLTDFAEAASRAIRAALKPNTTQEEG